MTKQGKKALIIEKGGDVKIYNLESEGYDIVNLYNVFLMETYSNGGKRITDLAIIYDISCLQSDDLWTVSVYRENGLVAHAWAFKDQENALRWFNEIMVWKYAQDRMQKNDETVKNGRKKALKIIT